MPRILDEDNHADLVPGIGVGAWIPFDADPGWNSTLRLRRIPQGVQLEGAARGPLPANALGRIGVLPPGFRPTHDVYAPVVVVVNLAYGSGFIQVTSGGGVFTQWSIEGTATGGASINVIFPTD